VRLAIAVAATLLALLTLHGRNPDLIDLTRDEEVELEITQSH